MRVKQNTNLAITIIILLVVSVVTILVVIGPLYVPVGNGEVQRSEKSISTDNTVVLQNTTFDPAYLTILQGSSVTWMNPSDSAQVKSVQSDQFANGTRVFDSGAIKAGESFTFTFNQTGNFTYHSGTLYYGEGSINVTPAVPEGIPTGAPVTPTGFPTSALLTVSISTSTMNGGSPKALDLPAHTTL